MFKRKMIISLFVVLLASMTGILILLFANPFSKEINLSKEAFILITDESVESSTTINIRGTVHNPLLKASYFEGEIEIESLDSTMNNSVVMLVQEKVKGLNYSSFFYGQTFDQGNVLMFFTDDFSEINLLMRDVKISNNTIDFIQVVAPASDEVSAQSVFERMQALYPDIPSLKDLDNL
ncbi:hypothetical protein MH215_01415 [Paenibacillus sp. ACRSA]|uniref:hypothetical protein n=1 Tax=Paenibacillus sp. ACRSA TaxID=2918211 RepID=UPI001EF6630B|nr:hypothetical protein [Paenibacillus sp. ACRSA]MCG7375634.1 hypothetical protein [Paenibacillus sp. ACRSA]